jgi:hypothetical protein
VTSGRCSTSRESRRNAWFPSLAASLPKWAASSLKESAPPRKRAATPLSAEANGLADAVLLGRRLAAADPLHAFLERAQAHRDVTCGGRRRARIVGSSEHRDLSAVCGMSLSQMAGAVTGGRAPSLRA